MSREVTVGDQLPAISLGLTSQRLTMIAAANRDFAPVHTNTEIAQSTGADDAYGNLMFVMAMMEHTLTAWAGPGSRLRELRSMRMSAFNRLGDTVSCRAVITGVHSGGGRVDLDVWLETSDDRRTATAQAVIDLPAQVG